MGRGLISDCSAPTFRCHTATRVYEVWVGVNERQVLACNIPFQTDPQHFREVATSSATQSWPRSLPTRLAVCVCWCTPNSPAAPIGPEPASPKRGGQNPSATALWCIIPDRAIAAGLEPIKHSTRFYDPLASSHRGALGWRREAWPPASHVPLATQTVCPDIDELREKTWMSICSNPVMENCCGSHPGACK